MNNAHMKPVVLAFAGPNGSGKTTIAKRYPKTGVYVNADDIKKEYELSDLDAAKMAEQIRNSLLDAGKSFSFETVLSTDRNLELLRRAKSKGYEIQCIYVLTVNPDINFARVKSRVLGGGHDVPKDKIYSRYQKALSFLPQLIEICDKILVFDNSAEEPVLIFEKNLKSKRIISNKIWTDEKLQHLFEIY